ncbi:MAG: ABC transporter permease [Pseudomonadota bacterium]
MVAAAETSDAQAVLLTDDGAMRLRAQGCWTIDRAGELDRLLERLLVASQGVARAQVVVDCGRLEHLDTAGAWLLRRAALELARGRGAPRFIALQDRHALLLETVDVPPSDAAGHARTRRSSIITDIGAATVRAAAFGYALIGFLGMMVVTIARVALTPRLWRPNAFVHHIEHVGLRAVPIIVLICVLIGAVVMQQGAAQLAGYGAQVYAVDLVAILSLREIGVLLTAIMVAGRSASAFTAEIGAMRMREEIDALRTLSIDPMVVLVVPRVLALLVMLPLLTFVANVACLAGGGVIAALALGMEPFDYLLRLQDALELRHLVVGMIKTPFIAVSIALIGCLEGMRVTGSADSLGRHVTSAVVKAIFVVIVLDAVFALFLSAIGV